MKTKLIFAVTEYDRKQSTKKYYNPYALGQYFSAVDETMALVEMGVPVTEALAENFQGHLLAFILKRI